MILSGTPYNSSSRFPYAARTIIGGLADDVSWGYHSTVENDIPWFGALNSPSEVAEGFFGAITANLDLTLFERKSQVASGDQVAVSYRAEGVIKKNGNGYIDEGMHLWSPCPTSWPGVLTEQAFRDNDGKDPPGEIHLSGPRSI